MNLQSMLENIEIKLLYLIRNVQLREDEMAFAELNGSYLKFVEDAARLLYEQLIKDDRVKDFRVICSHQESLHSHDAVSVILAPDSKFSNDVPHELWSSLIHIS